jgi:hypothetical protein
MWAECRCASRSWTSRAVARPSSTSTGAEPPFP